MLWLNKIKDYYIGTFSAMEGFTATHLRHSGEPYTELS